MSLADTLRGSPEDLYSYWMQNVRFPNSSAEQPYQQFGDWVNQTFAGPSMPSVNNLGKDYAIGGRKSFDKPLLGINPATGQAERIYQDTGPIQGWQDTIGNYFGSDPNRPDTAQAGLAGGHSYANPKTDWTEMGVIAGLAAISGGAFGPMLGAALGTSAGAAGGAVAGGVGAGMTSNWDPKSTLTGAGLGAVGGAVSGPISQAAGGGTLGSAAGGATSGATKAALTGGNIAAGALTGGAGNAVGNTVSGAVNDLSTPAPAGNDGGNRMGEWDDLSGWLGADSTGAPAYDDLWASLNSAGIDGPYGNSAAGGTGPGGAGASAAGGAAAAGTGSILSRLLGGGGNSSNSTADWLNLAGTIGAAGLGAYGQNEQSNRLKEIYDDMVAKREPYRQQSLAWLNDPNAYLQGPGAASLDATLRRLSVGGNPIGDPTKLGIATQAGLQNWQNAVTGMGNLGLSGEDARANVASNAAGAANDVYTNLGAGLGALTRPKRTLADYIGGLV